MTPSDPVLSPPPVNRTITPHVVPGERRIDYDSLLNKPDVTGLSGWNIETFAATTDVNGKMTVTLAHTPTGIEYCFCFVAEAERHVEPAVLSGKMLTVQKRKLLYDKPATPTGGATNVAGGGGVASGPFDTGDASPGVSISTTSSPVGGASGDAITSIDSASVDSHHHSVGSVIDHDHTLSFVPTSLEVADHEPTRILVLYQ